MQDKFVSLLIFFYPLNVSMVAVPTGYLRAQDAWHLLTSALVHFAPLGFGAINAIHS